MKQAWGGAEPCMRELLGEAALASLQRTSAPAPHWLCPHQSPRAPNAASQPTELREKTLSFQTIKFWGGLCSTDARDTHTPLPPLPLQKTPCFPTECFLLLATLLPGTRAMEKTRHVRYDGSLRVTDSCSVVPTFSHEQVWVCISLLLILLHFHLFYCLT